MDNEKVIFWTRNQTKMLIYVRLEMEQQFESGYKSKKSMWKDVHRKLKEMDEEFPFTVEETIKKFQNLLTTYKKIKKKNNQSGREATRWEYFEAFDEIYGNKHCIVPPAEKLFNSLNSENMCPDNENTETVPEKKRSVPTLWNVCGK